MVGGQLDGGGERIHVFVVGVFGCVWSCVGLVAVMCVCVCVLFGGGDVVVTVVLGGGGAT